MLPAMRCLRLPSAASGLALLALAAGAETTGQPQIRPGAEVAFMGMTFIDTSTEGAYFGARPDQAARIGLIEDEVRDELERQGLRVADLAPVRAELDRTKNPAHCNGCEVRMARELGADYVLVGEVQKVSNLILSMNLVMREAEGGTPVRGIAVDIRSNTDTSWLRGIRYILENHIFTESTG